MENNESEKISPDVRNLGRIYKALAAAQKSMGPLIKDTNNPHFKTKYADLAGVLETCLETLNDNGIAVFQPMRQIGEKSYVVTILAHESGETLENPVPVISSKNDMQGLGSAITYARRYGLMAMAGIAPEDDDGNAAAESMKARQQQSAPRQQAQRQKPDVDPVQMAVESLDAAKDLEALASIWSSLGAVQRNPRAIEAKDKRKSALQNPDNGEKY